MKLVLFAASLSTASSFVATKSPSFVSTALRAVGGMSDAEAHLEVMPKIWDELRKSEKDIIVQQQVGDVDEATASKALVENLLETALDFVQTKESIEEDLATAAHETFEHAIEEEMILEEHVMEESLKDVPLDSYIDNYLHEAQETEKRALQEEGEHLEKWKELHQEEEAIKSALEGLKKLGP